MLSDRESKGNRVKTIVKLTEGRLYICTCGRSNNRVSIEFIRLSKIRFVGCVRDLFLFTKTFFLENQTHET